MLDIVSILFLLIFFIRGYSKGIIVAVFSFLSILLGIVIALKLSATVSSMLATYGGFTSSWVPLLSYILIFTLVLLSVRWIARLLRSALQVVALGWLDSIAGGVLYVITAALVESTLLWVCDKVQLLSPSTMAESNMYPYIRPLAPWAYQHVGQLIPFVKSSVEAFNQAIAAYL